MTATKLRYMLIGLVVVLLASFGAGVWWVQGMLAEKVRETDHARTDADLSGTELQQLKQLKKQLEDQKDIVDRAKQIAATSAQYQYQDQVIKDVADYAARYGIQVNTFDFSTTNKNAAATNGAKKTPFTVSLKGPLAYVTFLNFLRDLEGNLTKIQVTSLTLAPDKDPNKISNPSLSCEVYLKS
ncbi:MAG TPA: hypothetical protein VLA88_03580 [Candidatus Saccharimonadales bacterium]|nr:hypothetical protein [Candidatus Saccharimonadales bacterium]